MPRCLLAAVALSVSLCVPAHAQDWPARTVTMVVPFAPGGERSPVFPDIATADEQGLKGIAANSWNGLFLPKAVPSTIVDKANAAVLKAMATPAVQQRVRELGATLPPPEHRTPQYLQSFVVSEIEAWGAAIKAAGITPE